MLPLVRPVGMAHAVRAREDGDATERFAAIFACVLCFFSTLEKRVLPFIWPVRVPHAGGGSQRRYAIRGFSAVFAVVCHRHDPPYSRIFSLFRVSADNSSLQLFGFKNSRSD